MNLTIMLQMIFQGEEMSIGIRGFTIGYDFYAPERSVCFHHYAEGKNRQARNKGMFTSWANVIFYCFVQVLIPFRLIQYTSHSLLQFRITGRTPISLLGKINKLLF